MGVDIDVDKVRQGCTKVFAFCKQSYFVPDTGFADFADADTRFNGLRKSQRCEKVSMVLDNQANRFAGMDV